MGVVPAEREVGEANLEHGLINIRDSKRNILRLFHRASVERPGLLKSVSTIFVFLAAFLFVASYLGGGTTGLIWAGLIAIVAVVVYLLFFGWIARLSFVRRVSEHGRPPYSGLARAPPPAQSMPSPSGSPPPAAISNRTRRAPQKRPSSRSKPEPSKPDIPAIQTRQVPNVCDSGPYDVEPGRPTKIRLEVETGSTIVGTLEERDGDDFEFKIVDEDNWVRYQQGRKFEVEDEGDGEGVYKIVWEAPSDGPWFLILEAYGKQLVRVVSVNLRLSRGP